MRETIKPSCYPKWMFYSPIAIILIVFQQIYLLETTTLPIIEFTASKNGTSSRKLETSYEIFYHFIKKPLKIYDIKSFVSKIN